MLIFVGAIAVVAALAGVAAQPSESVDFSRAWRFHRGDDPEVAPAVFPQSLDGCKCGEPFAVTPVGRKNATDCKRYAGATGAFAWNWTPEAPSWYAEQCKIAWTKPPADACDCKGKAQAGVLGGARPSVPPEPKTYSFAAPPHPDDDWAVVDAPHDAVIAGGETFDESCDVSHGYVCRPVSWYRKHARLPAEWHGQPVRLVIGAALQRTEVFVQATRVHTNELGYTPFETRIDQAIPGWHGGTPPDEIVIALRIDSSWGSGHWYEGGGLWSPEIRLECSASPRIVRDGVYAPPQADRTTINASAELVWDGAAASIAAGRAVSVRFSLLDAPPYALPADVPAALASGGASGAVLATVTTANVTLTQGAPAITVAATLRLSAALAPWSVQSPRLYGLVAEIIDTDDSATVLDVSPASAYATRSVSWSSDGGFALNGEHVTLQGFCDHDDSVGVGSAVPARLNLLRSQAMRLMGATHRRFSHNPPDTALPRIMSRLGLVTMSENRDYGLDRYLPFVTAFARRDRNEPSVAWWSVCNEVECFATDPDTPDRITKAFQAADPSRLVGANVFPVPNSQQAMYDSLQIQGLSHQKQQVFDTFHANYPNKPIVASESSSCLSQLSEPVVNRSTGAYWDNFNQPCGIEDFLKSGNLSWNGGVAGVWTATDYYGESGGWPHVSSSFGQLTLDALPKPAAFWYATRFLHTAQGPTRQPVGPDHTVRIVDDWSPSPAVGPPSTIRVVSSAPGVELYLDGSLVGSAKVAPGTGYASMPAPAFRAGNLTAVGLDAEGRAVASHAVVTPGVAASLRFVVAAPSAATGTAPASSSSSPLVADGRDAALVHCFVVDADGRRVVYTDPTNVTFRVVSGPGRIAGSGSANPTQDHAPPSAPWQPVYHGTVSVVVRVTADALTPTRLRAKSIDVDADAPGSTTVLPAGASVPDIVVEASAPGLGAVRTSIPVEASSSGWAKHSVLAAASATSGINGAGLQLASFAEGLSES